MGNYERIPFVADYKRIPFVADFQIGAASHQIKKNREYQADFFSFFFFPGLFSFFFFRWYPPGPPRIPFVADYNRIPFVADYNRIPIVADSYCGGLQ